MNSNQFEFVQQIAVTKFCRSDNDFHVTGGNLLQQPDAATCRSDLSGLEIATNMVAFATYLYFFATRKMRVVANLRLDF